MKMKKPDTPSAVRPNHAVVFTLLHEDPDLLIVDKPTGLVTQPGKGHATDALLNGIFALRDGHMGKLLHNLGERRDFGLLHRLDKDTSGLLVIAKTPNAYDQLRRDFEARHIDKEYLALVAGIPTPPQGVIQARLKEIEIPNPAAAASRGTGQRDYQPTLKKAVISREGQEAITAYKTLSKAAPPKPPASLLHLTIKTGRLHQIRAHMLFLNCHVLGDKLYAAPPDAHLNPKDYPPAPRLCLHASRLGFKHPATSKWTHYQSPLPPDLATYAARIGLKT